MPPRSTARKAAIMKAGIMLEIAEPSDLRFYRAQALSYAVICWKGDPASSEDILALADEFLQYISGNNETMPRTDQLIKGRIPKG